MNKLTKCLIKFLLYIKKKERQKYRKFLKKYNIKFEFFITENLILKILIFRKKYNLEIYT